MDVGDADVATFHGRSAEAASRPVGVIEIASSHGEGLQKYTPATSIEVAQRRLHKLAETLGAGLQASDDALKRAGGRTGGNIGRGAAVAAVRAERDSR